MPAITQRFGSPSNVTGKRGSRYNDFQESIAKERVLISLTTVVIHESTNNEAEASFEAFSPMAELVISAVGISFISTIHVHFSRRRFICRGQ